jgi:hypothetical protein
VNDEDLAISWSDLHPTVSQRRRIDSRVAAALQAHDSSLLTEWLNLFDVGRWRAIGLVAVSGVSIVTTAPLLWVARALW